MIQRYFGMIIETLGFFFFLIIVWSAVMGLANPPSWNSFVAYYNSWGGQVAQNVSIQGFFGQVIPVFQHLWVPAPDSWSAVASGSADGSDIFALVSFLVNILTGGLLSVLIGIGVLIWFVFFFFVNIVPVFTAAAFFFSGDLVANDLPGIVGRIDWGSLEGALPNGFPDPVPSWSFGLVG